MRAIKGIIKKSLAAVFYIIIFLFFVLSICEIWFRLNPEPAPYRYYGKKILSRVAGLWLTGQRTDPLLPPFRVFSNTAFADMERLRYIAKATRLPKNTKLTSYDFLRPGGIKTETSYSAGINNLGFRDPPRSAEKPKGVFRIIALGSYHTFGHAVGDEDAYPRQLEKILNSLNSDGISFEVWNGGRHTATAIVGLARLRTEILKYQPDLIIWDYGFVDPYVLGDDNLPSGVFSLESGIYQSAVRLLRTSRNILSGKSAVLSKFPVYLSRKSFQKNINDFMAVNRGMLETAQEYGIPVILLRQSIAYHTGPALYRKLTAHFKNSYFIDGQEIFEKYPPPPEAIEEFASGQNWLSEFNPALKNHGPWRFIEYYTDIYQYNKWGHRAIARYLAEEISVIAKKELLKNRQYKSPGE